MRRWNVSSKSLIVSCCLSLFLISGCAPAGLETSIAITVRNNQTGPNGEPLSSVVLSRSVCYALHVQAPDLLQHPPGPPRAASCPSEPLGIARFFGPFDAGQEVTINAPLGPNRRFDLIGFQKSELGLQDSASCVGNTLRVTALGPTREDGGHNVEVRWNGSVLTDDNPILFATGTKNLVPGMAIVEMLTLNGAEGTDYGCEDGSESNLQFGVFPPIQDGRITTGLDKQNLYFEVPCSNGTTQAVVDFTGAGANYLVSGACQDGKAKIQPVVVPASLESQFFGQGITGVAFRFLGADGSETSSTINFTLQHQASYPALFSGAIDGLAAFGTISLGKRSRILGRTDGHLLLDVTSGPGGTTRNTLALPLDQNNPWLKINGLDELAVRSSVAVVDAAFHFVRGIGGFHIGRFAETGSLVYGLSSIDNATFGSLNSTSTPQTHPSITTTGEAKLSATDKDFAALITSSGSLLVNGAGGSLSQFRKATSFGLWSTADDSFSAKRSFEKAYVAAPHMTTAAPSQPEAAFSVLAIDNLNAPLLQMKSARINTNCGPSQFCDISTQKSAVTFHKPNYATTPTLIGVVKDSSGPSPRVLRLDLASRLDGNFAHDNATGANGPVYAVAVQGDGKVILGGDFTEYNGIPRSRIVRLDLDGSVDTSFNPGDGFDQPVFAIAVQGNGLILVGGDFLTYDSSSAGKLIRLEANGTIDATFTGLTTGFDYPVKAIAVQSDGNILVGGDFTSYNGDTLAPDFLIRLDGTNGARDISFNGTNDGFDLPVNTIAVQSDGKVLAGGDFSSYNGIAGVPDRLIRLDSDGSVDSGFSGITSGFNNSVTSVAVDSSGKVLAGGAFTSFNGSGAAPDRFIRLNSNGALDGTFNGLTLGFNGPVKTIAVQGDGKILAGGSFTSFNGNPAAPDNLLRLNTDGSIDTTYPAPTTGFNAGVNAIALSANGEALVGGNFTSYNGEASLPDNFARINPNGTPRMPFNALDIQAGDLISAQFYPPWDLSHAEARISGATTISDPTGDFDVVVFGWTDCSGQECAVVYRSRDQGSSWHQVYLGDPHTRIIDAKSMATSSNPNAVEGLVLLEQYEAVANQFKFRIKAQTTHGF